MPDESLFYTERIRRLRQAHDAVEDMPGRPPADVLDQLTDLIREEEGSLRHHYEAGLRTIAEDLTVASSRLLIGIVTDDLGDGTRFLDMDLPSLGTLYGHFARAWDEIPEEWKVS